MGNVSCAMMLMLIPFNSLIAHLPIFATFPPPIQH